MRFPPGSLVTDRDLNCLSAPCEKFVVMKFERVDLYGAHLMLAEFTNCRFTDVIFTKAVMNRVHITDCSRFENCDFAGVTLCDSRLVDAQFINCPIDGSAISDNDEIGVIWLP